MSKLHLVFGGRVSDPQGLDFTDLHNLDVVGLYPDYKSAEKAWRSAAQRTGRRCRDEICRRPPAQIAAAGQRVINSSLRAQRSNP